MSDWKEEIANRLRQREERRNNIEKLENKIDLTLTDLLKELSIEYHIKTSSNLKYNKDNDPIWTIRIDNTQVELTSVDLFNYLKENDDLHNVLIKFILDNFKFY